MLSLISLGIPLGADAENKASKAREEMMSFFQMHMQGVQMQMQTMQNLVAQNDRKTIDNKDMNFHQLKDMTKEIATLEREIKFLEGKLFSQRQSKTK